VRQHQAQDPAQDKEKQAQDQLNLSGGHPLPQKEASLAGVAKKRLKWPLSKEKEAILRDKTERKMILLQREKRQREGSAAIIQGVMKGKRAREESMI